MDYPVLPFQVKYSAHKPLRLGVVGCGRVFERYHIHALRRSPDWHLIAACESLKERRDWAQRSLQGLPVHESFPALLESSTLDAMLITTPPATHYELTLQALQRGLHVLVEKPMALSPAEGQLMVETSLCAGRQLWVGFNRRFRQPYLDLQRRVAALARDAISAVHFELVTAWKPVTPYLGQLSTGGDILDDVASHQLDLLPWLMDRRVKDVKAERPELSTVATSFLQYQLRFEDGLVAFCKAGHGRRYAEHLEVHLKDRLLLAHPGGVLATGLLPRSGLLYYGGLQYWTDLLLRRLTRRPSLTLQSFEDQLAAFAAVIREGTGSCPVPDTSRGLWVLQAIKACRESLESGGNWKPVRQPGEGES